MHPLITRFLNAAEAIAVLEKGERALAGDAPAAALREAAREYPDAHRSLLEAKGRSHPSNESQQSLILLAVEAATTMISQDPALGPKVTLALEALQAEGATEDEAHHLVAQSVLEEAFSFAGDPDEFDQAFLAETLDELPVLSKVTEDFVDDLLDGFAKAAAAPQRPMRFEVAQTLLESAWSEGPQPISAEHVDDSLELVSESVATSEFGKAAEELAAFVAFLARKGLVGPLRQLRLVQIIESSAVAGVDPGHGEEDDESGAAADAEGAAPDEDAADED